MSSFDTIGVSPDSFVICSIARPLARRRNGGIEHQARRAPAAGRETPMNSFNSRAIVFQIDGFLCRDVQDGAGVSGGSGATGHL